MYIRVRKVSIYWHQLQADFPHLALLENTTEHSMSSTMLVHYVCTHSLGSTPSSV